MSVTMTVKNVGRIPANDVYLGRWFDGDVDSTTDNMYYATPDSVYAWRVPGPNAHCGYGLSLSSLTPATAHWPIQFLWLGRRTRIATRSGIRDLASPTARPHREAIWPASSPLTSEASP